MTIRFAATPLGALRVGDLEGVVRAQRGRALPAAAAPALLATERAAEGLHALRGGSALAVTTGQQAGLFTGPLYAFHKALGTAALAEALTQRHGTPVVPVFWVAGDDHDFAEINHCDVLGADGRLARIVLRERTADAPMLPAYREAVGAQGVVALAQLEQALPPSEFRGEMLAWLGRTYRPDHSLAEAFEQALAEALGRFGVVVCRGWDPAIKLAAAPVLLGALRNAASLDRALAAEAQRLRGAGREAPVAVGEGMTLVMLEGRAGRDRLRIAGDGAFQARRGGEQLTLADLERVLATEPGRLSGNVLLRPAVEAFLLPTVAYLGGPGELAYLAQAGPVFDALGVPRPAALPRLSGLLIEAKVDKVLEQHRLAAQDLARPEGDLAAALAREDLPTGAVAALEAARGALAERYAAFQAEAVAIEKTLEKPVENARNQALRGLQEIEKKLVAALRRQNETALQQVARAREQLYPAGKPQERVLCVASFLSRHGAVVLDVMYEAARAHARWLLEGAPREA